MAINFQHLPPPVAQALRHFLWRRRLALVLRGLAWVALLVLLYILVVTHLDRLLFLTPATRLCLTQVGHGLAIVGALAVLLREFFRRLTLAQVAYAMQGRLKTGHHELYATLEAVQQAPLAAPDTVGAQLLGELSRQAVAHSQTLQPGRLARDPGLRRVTRGLLAVLALYGLLAWPASYQWSLMLQRYLQPRATLAKPSFLHLTVNPGPALLGQGAELVLQVQVSGELPAPLRWLLARLGQTPGRAWVALAPGELTDMAFTDPAAERLELSRVDRQLYLFTRADLRDSLTLRVRSGDAESLPVVVRVVAQPKITDFVMTITPPAYANLPPQEERDWRRGLQVLPGSTVALRFNTDQAVPTRELKVGGLEEAPELTWDDASRTGTASLLVQTRLTVELQVTNAEGFSNVEPVKLTINLREDGAPVVRLEYPPAEIRAVAAELVPFQALVEDDLGIKEMVYQVTLNPEPDTERAPRELPIVLPEDAGRTLNLKTALELDQTGAAPGDLVLVKLRARDSNGSDGYSREVLIRVTPFTRDDNERQRLQRLRFLAGALLRFSAAAGYTPAGPGVAPPKAGVPWPAAPGREAWSATLEQARQLGWEWGSEPSWEPLLELLELEHHFTDRPRHQEDLRGLLVVLGWACANGEAGGAQAAELDAMGRELLPGLLRLRWAKNIAWRYYGMLAEGDQLRARLLAMTADEGVDKTQSDALRKRLELYGDSLQELGSELIELARATPSMALGTIEKEILELNTNAYQLKRGSLPRRLERLELVTTAIASALGLLRPALPLLAAEEAKQRRVLRERYQATVTAWLAAQTGATLAAAASRSLLGAEARMLAREPLGQPWERLTRLLWRDALALPEPAAQTAALAALTPLLAPTGELAERVQAGQQAARQRAFEWELARAVQGAALSPAERHLELHLSELELLWEAGAPLATRTLLANQVSNAPPAAELATFDARAWLANWRERWRLPTEALAAAEALASTPLPAWPTPAARLSELAALLRRHQSQAETLDAALRAGEADRLRELARELPARLPEQLAALERAATAAELSAAWLPVSEPAPAVAAALMIRLRELAGRHAGRAQAFLAAQRSLGAAATSGDLGGMGADLAQWRQLLTQLQQSLTLLGEQLAAGKLGGEEDLARYAQLRVIADLRARLARLAPVPLAAKPHEAAALWLSADPVDALAWLGRQAPLLGQAETQVQTLESALNATPTDLPGAERARLAADGALAQLLAAVERLPAAESLQLWRERLVAVRASLAAPAAGGGEAELAKRRFAIDGTRRTLKKLGEDLDRALEETQTALEAYRGGPPGIWGERLRPHAEASRERLLSQVLLARARVVEGVGEGLLPQAGVAPLQAAVAWLRVDLALAHSELYGEAGVRPPARGDEQKGDPRLRYLLEELDKALQFRDLRYYQDLTREYLISLRSFLRS